MPPEPSGAVSAAAAVASYAVLFASAAASASLPSPSLPGGGPLEWAARFFDFLMSGTPASVAVSVAAGVILVLLFGAKGTLVRRVRALFGYETSTSSAAAASPGSAEKRRIRRKSKSSPSDAETTDTDEYLAAGIWKRNLVSNVRGMIFGYQE